MRFALGMPDPSAEWSALDDAGRLELLRSHQVDDRAAPRSLFGGARVGAEVRVALGAAQGAHRRDLARVLEFVKVDELGTFAGL